MKAKYYANYLINNDQHVRPSYTYTNKRVAIRDIRAIAEGNVQRGNFGTWHVTDQTGQIIASGSVRD